MLSVCFTVFLIYLSVFCILCNDNVAAIVKNVCDIESDLDYKHRPSIPYAESVYASVGRILKMFRSHSSVSYPHRTIINTSVVTPFTRRTAIPNELRVLHQLY